MDYEQKYKEALETAKAFYRENKDFNASFLHNIFPELRENNDEKIRKGLIKSVSRIFEGHKLYDTDVTREEALAWLEKQGENKNLDADKVIAWLVANICDFEYYVKLFKKDFGL